MPIHEFTNVVENKRENTAASEKDGSDTDSDIESDPSIIPEPLTSLFDPTAVNMDDFTLDEHARKQFNLYGNNFAGKITFKGPLITLENWQRSNR